MSAVQSSAAARLKRQFCNADCGTDLSSADTFVTFEDTPPRHTAGSPAVRRRLRRSLAGSCPKAPRLRYSDQLEGRLRGVLDDGCHRSRRGIRVGQRPSPSQDRRKSGVGRRSSIGSCGADVCSDRARRCIHLRAQYPDALPAIERPSDAPCSHPPSLTIAATCASTTPAE